MQNNCSVKNFIKLLLSALFSCNLVLSAAHAKKDEPTNGGRGGGWGSSGGGSGVACFSNENDAREADEFILAGKALPSEVRQKIITLVTLEYWEWTRYTNSKLFNFKSNDYKGILYEVEERGAVLSPTFIYRLKQAREIINFSTWNSNAEIPRVYDADPLKPIPAECRQIQLALRLSNKNNLNEQGPVKHKPEVRVEFNSDLFELLNPLNKAMLIVHENMYLLAQSIGYLKSDRIRPVVIQFFTEELFEDFRRMTPKGPQIQDMRNILVEVFGDYIIYFNDDTEITAKPFSQEARYKSFYKLNQTLRTTIRSCASRIPKMASPEATRKRYIECKDATMIYMASYPHLDPETAFLFLTHYLYDTIEKKTNSEFLFTPLKSPEFLKQADAALVLACRLLRRDQKNLVNEKMGAAAVSYCDLISPL